MSSVDVHTPSKSIYNIPTTRGQKIPHAIVSRVLRAPGQARPTKSNHTRLIQETQPTTDGPRNGDDADGYGDDGDLTTAAAAFGSYCLYFYYYNHYYYYYTYLLVVVVVVVMVVVVVVFLLVVVRILLDGNVLNTTTMVFINHLRDKNAFCGSRYTRRQQYKIKRLIFGTREFDF